MTSTIPARRPTEFAPGDVLEAKALAMRSTLLELSDRVLRTEVVAGPTANGGPLHRHMHQEERFDVHAGALRVRLGLRHSRIVTTGESVTVPPRTPHTFKVDSPDGARFTATFTPPLRILEYFGELFALDQPRLRDIARLAHEYPAEHFYLPLVPPALQRALLRPAA